MIGSAAIDVAVGVVFTYFLFAMLCSGIAEYISKLFNSRGKLLHDAINRLLGPDAHGFWEHPLISQLSEAHGIWPQSVIRMITKRSAEVSTAPSYIAASTFASAVLSVIRPPDQGDANVVGQGSGSASAAPQRAGPDAAASEIEKVILSLWPGAAGDAEKLRAALEQWYKDWTDRLSGYYKRYTKIILFALALVLTVAFNVNTFLVAQSLWREPTVRAAIAQSAAGAKQQPQPLPGDVFKEVQQEVKIGLPIGWSAAKSPAGKGASGWLWAIAGWLVTAGALTFGAPFWFDMLGRLNSLRSTGPPPGSSTASAA
jgi:hypothetical protein